MRSDISFTGSTPLLLSLLSSYSPFILFCPFPQLLSLPFLFFPLSTPLTLPSSYFPFFHFYPFPPLLNLFSNFIHFLLFIPFHPLFAFSPFSSISEHFSFLSDNIDFGHYNCSSFIITIYILSSCGWNLILPPSVLYTFFVSSFPQRHIRPLQSSRGLRGRSRRF